MKISEKLSEIKRKEGELSRLVETRKNIFKKEFSGFREANKEDFKKEKDFFMNNKKEEFIKLSDKIYQLTEDIISDKNKINNLNIKAGIDKKILEIKYIRIELSRIMKLLSEYSYDPEVGSFLSIEENIKQLENDKSRIDAEIQHFNWSTEL